MAETMSPHLALGMWVTISVKIPEGVIILASLMIQDMLKGLSLIQNNEEVVNWPTNVVP